MSLLSTRLMVVPGLRIQAEEADNLTIKWCNEYFFDSKCDDGSSIQWRYKALIPGELDRLSYVTSSDMNSSTVDCSNPVSFSISQTSVHVLEEAIHQHLQLQITKVQQVIFMSSTKSIVVHTMKQVQTLL